MPIVLQVCGGIATLIASWRSYAVAREAVAPLAHEGDPTRRAIEGARPLPMRPRVRSFLRRVAVSVGWLAIAMYGLYLFAYGQGMTQ